MKPPYSEPEEAVRGLIEAYQSLDIELVVANKDFYLDAVLFWQSLGLADESRITKSTAAFEKNFRREMDEKGMPDYRGVTFTIKEKERLSESLSIVQFSGTTESGEGVELRIPVVKKAETWCAVLHPGYDHF